MGLARAHSGAGFYRLLKTRKTTPSPSRLGIGTLRLQLLTEPRPQGSRVRDSFSATSSACNGDFSPRQCAGPTVRRLKHPSQAEARSTKVILRIPLRWVTNHRKIA